MGILIEKGIDRNYSFSSADYPTLTSDWTGSVSFYTDYPGTPVFSKTLIRAGNVMTLSLTIAEILNLPDGVYAFVSTITNSVLGVSVTSVDYATVTPVNISASTMCKIYGTIEKPDGSPTGTPTSTLANSTVGMVLQQGWKGVEVRAGIPIADADSGKVVSIEQVVTTTNAAGYFELYVIQGLPVTVTCQSFGKSVAVATIGQTAIDISTFF